MAINLQDAYLLQIKKMKEPVTIYLVNGIQLRGIVKGFDNFTIFIESPDEKMQLIYKHAVTTIHTIKATMTDFITNELSKNSEKEAINQ